MLAEVSELVFVEQMFGFHTGHGFGALQKVNGQQPQNVQQYRETVERLPTQPRRETQ